MKKTTKVLFLTAAFCLSVLNAYALNSAAYESSAHTIEDDAYAMMNVLDWKNLEFKNACAFSNLNSTSSGNIASVFHINGENVLGLSWEGNLWSETSYNSLTGFYGWDKFAVTLNLTEYMSPSWYMDSTICEDYKNIGGKSEFGYLINNMFDLKLALGVANTSGTINTADINYTDFLIGSTLYYKMKDDSAFKVKFFLDYEGAFASREATVGNNQTKTSYSQNVIKCGTKLLYKTDMFSYGLYGAIPITIISGDDISTDVNLDFILSNGFSVILNPDKLLFNAGAEISFPSITFHENEDTEKGIFFTTFYAGFSFILNKMIKLDISTGLNPNNGISFDDIWNQNFNISLSAKF